jgi:serine/threonine protein kinase
VFMKQLAEAMNYIHQCGIYYRDFKRSNLRFDGVSLTVIDFDCAQIFDPQHPPCDKVGTKGYRAPEVENCSPSNFSADTWSVGRVFCRELIRLARGESTARVMMGAPMKHALIMCSYSYGATTLEYDLLSRLLQQDPTQRISDEELLLHPYFKQCTVE